MQRRYYLGVAAVLAALGMVTAALCKIWLTPTHAPATQARPNVVLISLDTTRADHLGCYGYSRPTSPNLDRLAAGGVRYAGARSQASWTYPSHMSLFTSMLPSHCQVHQLVCLLSDKIPTLAEILRDHGYHTAGLVNDGQMNAKLRFNRGFDEWQEYPAETPAGNCVHVTDEALQWLGKARPEPFFLFLHYYDAHAPYEPLEEFRQQFGSTLSGPETARIMRRPNHVHEPMPDPDMLRQVIASYDGEIAWLDRELGRLFARLPDNTLVVVFADHGEAFKEHGWTQHGASLYEEEVHVPLLMSMPSKLPQDLVVDEPVMLLDVAPTILALCGISAPAHYEGCDLAPTWVNERLPQRPSLSETKVQYEGQAVKMVLFNEWKLVRSVLDGREELYRLPDEKTNLAQREMPVRDTLSALAQRWLAEEDFWMLYAHGPGELNATLVPRSGQFLNVFPFGEELDGDSYRFDPKGRTFQWKCVPGARTKGVFFQIAPADNAVHFDLSFGEKRRPDQVFLGRNRAHPDQVPFDLTLEGAAASDPVIDRPFHADKPGFYVFRHRAREAPTFPAIAGTLDEQTIRQLRSLGYLR